MSLRSVCRVVIPACALAALLLGGTFALGACRNLCRDVTDGWTILGGTNVDCYTYGDTQVHRVYTTSTIGTEVNAVDKDPVVRINRFYCQFDCTDECPGSAPAKASPTTLCPPLGQVNQQICPAAGPDK
jgi:hypothetical protein